MGVSHCGLRAKQVGRTDLHRARPQGKRCCNPARISNAPGGGVTGTETASTICGTRANVPIWVVSSSLALPGGHRLRTPWQ